MAGLPYLGAGVALTAARVLRGRTDEAPLRRADLPTLALVSLAGGVLGPLLMLHGLRASSVLGASLMLNLEAPFTIALAALVFREHLGPRAMLASALIVAGVALLLRERHGHAHTHEPLTHAHDEHHQHAHEPDDPAGSPHAHAHTHDALTHDHPHVPDLHHRHRH